MRCCQEEQPIKTRIKDTPDSRRLLRKEKKKKKKNRINSKRKRGIITAKCRNINKKTSGNTSKKHYAAVQVIASQKWKTQFAAYLLASVSRPKIFRDCNPKQNDGEQGNERTEGNQVRINLQLAAGPEGL